LTKNVSREAYLENETAKINDTRYITSYIADYLKQEMEIYKVAHSMEKAPEIISVNGIATSQMRRL